jgi:hypothetical protein
MGSDLDLEQETKLRIADRFTSAEMVELLDVPVEDIIDIYWNQIIENLELFN